jgi:hypothetical protein
VTRADENEEIEFYYASVSLPAKIDRKKVKKTE